MKSLFVIIFLPSNSVFAQTTKLWTEENRKYLLDNLERTKT